MPLVDGDRKGAPYEVANGAIIRNQGQRKCTVVNRDGGAPKILNLQVMAVHKPLLSVAELVRAGHRVVFDRDRCYIQDKKTGWCDTIDQTEDSFELTTWVKAAPSEANKSPENAQAQGFGRPAR